MRHEHESARFIGPTLLSAGCIDLYLIRGALSGFKTVSTLFRAVKAAGRRRPFGM
jgi:hypothetical protein